ncbi:cupredoxin domain-containing protein [Paenibacillus cellulositrophicus]|uniref:Cytochrome C oxidase subunit II n=3 Tax=Paenibacillus TaxID=44249 RepID=A0A1R1ESD5_9BACL|nr:MULTISPECIES: cupredoxin domain-containing protein [Paenibacillus]MBJ9993170.1 cupredoxin domain-containing protein [Paenibacillus sp. S28]MCM2996352.1 cupredoxin domain-containing protein [Paenibacillus cellulositrophicus]MEC0175143.1 cupredoxin domain-containing protein [Paenibacillus favisporus]OMF54773.1 cytochrome C oxidase subunit II [Paenibacillus rhizosphaerae]PQP91438.1 cytochrome C oxidase subunit II [Paenibacillus sp. AR247]
MKKTLAVVLSCVLLLVLAACGQSKSGDSASGSGVTETGVAPSEELVIKATNYAFDQKEYHLKKGVPVKITLENDEGNHGVLIPGLELQLDGKNKSAVVTPEKAGTFEMACSVFCGAGHSGMIAKVIVE